MPALICEDDLVLLMSDIKTKFIIKTIKTKFMVFSFYEQIPHIIARISASCLKEVWEVKGGRFVLKRKIERSLGEVGKEGGQVGCLKSKQV